MMGDVGGLCVGGWVFGWLGVPEQCPKANRTAEQQPLGGQ